MIIDYSLARPTIAELKAHGVTAVGRYIGWDGEPGYQNTGKNITKPEAKALLAAGISVFLAFEYVTDAAARGAAQGHADGQLAASQLAGLGAPPGMAVYFACDWDIPDYSPSLPDTPASAIGKLGPVGQYFTAINNLRYPFAVGVYGGYYAVKRVMDAGLATLGWQTIAWSGGQLDPRATIYQTAASSPVYGTDVDIRENAALQEDFGQWPRPAPQPIQESGMIIITVDTKTVPVGKAWPGIFLGGYVPGELWHIPDQATLQAYEALSLPAKTISYAQYVLLGGK